MAGELPSDSLHLVTQSHAISVNNFCSDGNRSTMSLWQAFIRTMASLVVVETELLMLYARFCICQAQQSWPFPTRLDSSLYISHKYLFIYIFKSSYRKADNFCTVSLALGLLWRVLWKLTGREVEFKHFLDVVRTFTKLYMMTIISLYSSVIQELIHL